MPALLLPVRLSAFSYLRAFVLVVYGLYTGQSIGKLFFGNVIPSVILTVLIAATVFYICWRHPDWGPKGPKSTWMERFKAIPDLLDIFILFAIIMYALFTGVVTATEAAAASCAIGLVLVSRQEKAVVERLYGIYSQIHSASHALYL